MILLIFTRDLSLKDNATVYAAVTMAAQTANRILCAFCFDPRQCTTEKNKYFSQTAFSFMCGALEDLRRQLGGHLYYFAASAATVAQKLQPEHIFISRDYTPFAKLRQRELERIAPTTIVSQHTLSDLSALPHDYQRFTAFYNTQKAQKPRKSVPQIARYLWKSKPAIATTKISQFCTNIDNNARRSLALRIKPQSGSQLSPYVKFGIITARELYVRSRDANFRRNLFWRDFFMHLMDTRGFTPIIRKSIKWNTNRAVFLAWCRGQTQIPIIDAAMHRLNATGYLENHWRLLVASYLVKTLRINWQWGERYFAQQLRDYDPASNFGNWTWVAGVGSDYYKDRRFSPERQAKKHDKDGRFIKEWL